MKTKIITRRLKSNTIALAANLILKVFVLVFMIILSKHICCDMETNTYVIAFILGLSSIPDIMDIIENCICLGAIKNKAKNKQKKERK